MGLVVWGIVTFSLWPTFLRGAVGYLGKLWFVDRMVWLFEDMKDAVPEYRSWLYERREKRRDYHVQEAELSFFPHPECTLPAYILFQ